MDKKYRIWFSELNSEGMRETRRYFISDLTTAAIVLRINITELERVKEVYPNMFGLEEWNEMDQDWYEWESESGQDIREFIYSNEFDSLENGVNNK